MDVYFYSLFYLLICNIADLFKWGI